MKHRNFIRATVIAIASSAALAAIGLQIKPRPASAPTTMPTLVLPWSKIKNLTIDQHYWLAQIHQRERDVRKASMVREREQCLQLLDDDQKTSLTDVEHELFMKKKLHELSATKPAE